MSTTFTVTIIAEREDSFPSNRTDDNYGIIDREDFPSLDEAVAWAEAQVENLDAEQAAYLADQSNFPDPAWQPDLAGGPFLRWTYGANLDGPAGLHYELRAEAAWPHRH